MSGVEFWIQAACMCQPLNPCLGLAEKNLSPRRQGKRTWSVKSRSSFCLLMGFVWVILSLVTMAHRGELATSSSKSSSTQPMYLDKREKK